MSLTAGLRLGPYEILSTIGTGGMGEVYKARDTRLDRIVAIKKNLGPFSERFEREARAIAKLNHPHICSLYDVGPDYLVMEYVEGKPLQGPLPVSEALRLAKQVLDAMEAAHRSGIVHRDLKPGNVLVTKTGVKLLDFGLAKAIEPDPLNGMTVSAPLTGAGTILGTPQYMSPEQLEGTETDARTDIFAFGLILYELITGRRAFEAKSGASLIASILKEQPPPISEIAPPTPKAIDRVVATCLEKDPENRWQSAREIRHALDWITTESVSLPAAGSAERNAESGPSSRRWQAATAAAAIVAFAALGWAFRPTAQPPPAEAVRFEVQPPDKGRFDMYVSLSPDGRHLAYRAIGEDGVSRAWIRDMDTLVPRALPGTEGSGSLTWSPDSRYLAYASGRQLKKVDIQGGPPQTLCEVMFPVGSGAWSEDGTILFGGRGSGPLHRVAAAGGSATPVTAGAGGFSSFPQFLPDNRHFIYYRSGPVSGIFVGSLDATPETQPTNALLSSNYGAVLERTDAPPGGRLLFVRDTTLMVQPFDVTARTLAGQPVPFVEGIATVNQYIAVSASRTGALAFRTGGRAAGRVLNWFARDGKALGTVGSPGEFVQFALSPDGTRIISRDRAVNSEGDLWLLDLAKGTNTRFTFTRSATDNHSPIWSPDGQRIAFGTSKGLFQRLANGAADAELVAATDDTPYLDSWSRDGRYIFFTVINTSGRRDISLLRMADRSVSVWLQDAANETQAVLSPDGKWVAYISDESGRSEMFVRPFDRAGASRSARWQVSRNGAISPQWRDDGKELFFKDLTGVPVSVAVSASGNAFESGAPERLPIEGAIWPSWGVTGDGQRVLLAFSPQASLETPITVLLNWASAIER